MCVGGRCHKTPSAGDLGGGGGGGDLAAVPGDMQGSPTDLATSGSSCAHSLCSSGAKLANGCDPCVTKICAQDSYCCVNNWSSQCVKEVTSICNQSCP